VKQARACEDRLICFADCQWLVKRWCACHVVISLAQESSLIPPLAIYDQTLNFAN
jgi:hypothetical protein